MKNFPLLAKIQTIVLIITLCSFVVSSTTTSAVADFISAYGTVEFMLVLMGWIYVRIWKQTKKIIWHIVMVLFLSAVLAIFYYMLITGNY